MAKGDKFASWEALLENTTEGVDYRVTVQRASGSAIAIIAPHGGGIESLTLELARLIAGSDHNFYAFEGIRKTNNWDLHITSHHFKEERAIALLKTCDQVVAIHGLGGPAKSLQVGGSDGTLGKAIHDVLVAAKFDSKIEITGAYAGVEPLNICNRGRMGQGVQLELRAGLRDLLKKDNIALTAFVEAIRSVL
ncbi:poly-gamma-glutamate hydrolase family protein [Mesorhizobium sp. M0757]|uniref:poly-gamma-glutamate hydrolase family protein n=1 Tax=Mesorhizobium sp. M0757 TaxID=2956993 RepID=UPI00333A91E6